MRLREEKTTDPHEYSAGKGGHLLQAYLRPLTEKRTARCFLDKAWLPRPPLAKRCKEEKAGDGNNAETLYGAAAALSFSPSPPPLTLLYCYCCCCCCEGKMILWGKCFMLVFASVYGAHQLQYILNKLQLFRFFIFFV